MPLEVQFNMKHGQFAAFDRTIERLAKKEMAHYVIPNLFSRFSQYFTGKINEEAKSKISQYDDTLFSRNVLLADLCKLIFFFLGWFIWKKLGKIAARTLNK